MEYLSTILDYYVTGGLKVLETGMIILLLVFLGWNVKLYLEEEKEGERLDEQQK